MTTVQDLPGRLGYWHVGVPPSGPFDPVSFAEANLAVGNPAGARRSRSPRAACPPLLHAVGRRGHRRAGAVTLDGEPVGAVDAVEVPAGGVLTLGSSTGPGLRTYVAVRGGIDVPSYLGSASTFTLGGFGGHGGRALLAGDVLRPGTSDTDGRGPARRPRRPPPGT